MTENIIMLVITYCISRRNFGPVTEALYDLPEFALIETVKDNDGKKAKKPTPLVLATLVLLDQSKFDLSSMIRDWNHPWFNQVYQECFTDGDKKALIAMYRPYYQNNVFYYQLSEDFKLRMYWPAVPKIQKYLEERESAFRISDVNEGVRSGEGEPLPSYSLLPKDDTIPPPAYDEAMLEQPSITP
ncbi:hypothetical protein H4R33_000789 [Dimargaris cristalligena]|nr:hypothetical protein H4R33_000789 [Dimargaris cristalligena]